MCTSTLSTEAYRAQVASAWDEGLAEEVSQAEARHARSKRRHKQQQQRKHEQKRLKAAQGAAGVDALLAEASAARRGGAEDFARRTEGLRRETAFASRDDDDYEEEEDSDHTDVSDDNGEFDAPAQEAAARGAELDGLVVVDVSLKKNCSVANPNNVICCVVDPRKVVPGSRSALTDKSSEEFWHPLQDVRMCPGGGPARSYDRWLNNHVGIDIPRFGSKAVPCLGPGCCSRPECILGHP